MKPTLRRTNNETRSQRTACCPSSWPARWPVAPTWTKPSARQRPAPQIGAVAGALLGGVTAGGNKTKSAATGAAIGAALGAGGLPVVAPHAGAEGGHGTGDAGYWHRRHADGRQPAQARYPDDLSFDSGRYDIKPALHAVLDRFATTLNQNPVTTVRVVGHTDNVGSDAVNNPLSVESGGSNP